MNKVVDKPVKISEKRTRHTFRLFGDPSFPEDGTKTKMLHRLLQDLVDNMSLIQCGPGYPDKMAIYHDGTRWVISAESEADEV